MYYNDDGEIKEIKVKSYDTLPVGTIVEYDGDTIPEGWEEVENVLYENETGTTGNVPLNDNIKNYKKISIEYAISGGGMQQQKTIPTNNNAVNTIQIEMFWAGSTDFIDMATKRFTTSERLLTVETSRTTELLIKTSGITVNPDTTNRIIVTKVIGHK